MQDIFLRQKMLVGQQAHDKLSNSHVVVFGLGGVGSYAVEALARAGVGQLTLIDNDVISAHNVNRQLFALHSTMGQYKVEVAKQRILDINPNCKVNVSTERFLTTNYQNVDFSQFSYVVDAIDVIASKVIIASQCQQLGIPVISVMGTGNKIHPEQLRIADIYDTTICRVCKIMRKLLRKAGVNKLKVVYSPEVALVPDFEPDMNGHQTAGSTSYLPPVAGLMAAGQVIRDIIGEDMPKPPQTED